MTLIEKSLPTSFRPNPWTRSGVTIMKDATTNPDLAMRQAGLNWQVNRVDLRTADTLDPVPEFAAIRRSDNNSILGVVGADYSCFQNASMFDVFKDLASVDGGLPFTIETAGSFQRGRIVWAMAHLPDLGIRIGDDESKTYLLVSNGHTGNRTLIIAPTTIRVICQNTLRMAESQIRGRTGLAGGFILKHTPGIHAAVADAKAAFAATIKAHATTKEAWHHLASKPLSARLEKDFLTAVFGKPGPDEAERAKTIRKHREGRLSEILASPTSQVSGTKDSAYSLLNAVTEWIDHERTTRGAENADEGRLFSATMGSGSVLKEKAWGAIMDLVA